MSTINLKLRLATTENTMLLSFRALCTWLMLSLSVGGGPASAEDRLSLNGATAEVCFTPGRDCASLVAAAVAGARERVWLMGYGFSEPTILQALKEAHSRRVDVKVILDRSNDNGRYSGATYMAKVGVPVLIDRTVKIAHNKLILIDRDVVVVGSLNWTKSGNTKNAENVHVFRGARLLANQHEAYFQSRATVSEPYSAVLPGPRSR